MESQFGGSLLGQGAYGCVFRPPLLCENQVQMKNKEKLLTSKIAEPNDIDKEVEVSAALRTIPLSRNYFIYSVDKDSCIPSFKNKRQEPDFDYCKMVKGHSLRSLRMYRMPFGGSQTLGSMKTGDFAAFDFWTFGKHLLEGVTLLLINGIVHLDLHAGNVLIDDNNIPRIIDWGKAQRPFSEKQVLLAHIQRRRYDPRYVQEPPEIPLFVAKYLGLPTDATIETLFTNKSRKRVVMLMELLLGAKKETMRAQVEAYRAASLFYDKNTDFVRWWKAHWATMDSWAIGVLLMNKLVMFLAAGGSLGNKETQVYKALRGLLNFNCFKRFNAAQALDAWDGAQNTILTRYASKWI